VQRIAIVGNGGSGKTWLANRLGRLLGLPVTHLDDLRYAADGTTVAEDSFTDQQQTITAGDRWIIVLLTELRRAFPQVSDGFGCSSLRLS
jgi:adenylate kinase family enzyme